MALKRVGGDQDVLKDVAAIFLDSSSRQLKAVGDAVQAGDAKALSFAAHALKGSVLSFEALKTAQVAQELEELGQTGTTDGSRTMLAELTQRYLEMRVEIEKL